MSRLEYNQDFNTTDIDNTTTHISQSHCSFCFEPHCANDVGMLSPQYKVWFCSGSCQIMYFHDNKLGVYPPCVVKVLEEMRVNFYSPKKIAKKRAKCHY